MGNGSVRFSLTRTADSSLSIRGTGITRTAGGNILILHNADQQKDFTLNVSDYLVFDPGNGNVKIGGSSDQVDAWNLLSVLGSSTIKVPNGKLEINAVEINFNNASTITGKFVQINSSTLSGDNAFVIASDSVKFGPIRTFAGGGEEVNSIFVSTDLNVRATNSITFNTRVGTESGGGSLTIAPVTVSLYSKNNRIDSRLTVDGNGTLNAESGLNIVGAIRNNGTINAFQSVINCQTSRIDGNDGVIKAGGLVLTTPTFSSANPSRSSSANIIQKEIDGPVDVYSSGSVFLQTQEAVLSVGVIKAKSDISVSTLGKELHLGSSASNALTPGNVRTSNGTILLSGPTLTIGNCALIQSTGVKGSVSIIAGLDVPFTRLSSAPVGWNPFSGTTPSLISVSASGVGGGSPALVSNGGIIKINGSLGNITFTGQTRIAALRPISFIEQSSRRLCSSISKQAEMYCIDNCEIYELDSKNSKLEAGQVIIYGKTDYSIVTNFGTLFLKKGSIVDLEQDEDSLTVRCVKDNWRNSVSLSLGEGIQPVFLTMGQEMHISKSAFRKTPFNGLPFRNQQGHLIKEKYLETAEFSFLSYLSASQVLKEMVRSDISEHRRIGRQILCSSAAYSLATVSHGAFKNEH